MSSRKSPTTGRSESGCRRSTTCAGRSSKARTQRHARRRWMTKISGRWLAPWPDSPVSAPSDGSWCVTPIESADLLAQGASHARASHTSQRDRHLRRSPASAAAAARGAGPPQRSERTARAGVPPALLSDASHARGTPRRVGCVRPKQIGRGPVQPVHSLPDDISRRCRQRPWWACALATTAFSATGGVRRPRPPSTGHRPCTCVSRGVRKPRPPSTGDHPRARAQVRVPSCWI
jgi:hypothetical protein